MTSSKPRGWFFCVSLAAALLGGAEAARAAEGKTETKTETKAETKSAPPVVPTAIAAPADAKLTAKLHGVGAQIYGCAAASEGGKPAWTLKRPDAKLYDGSGAAAGNHGAGPIWTAKDGSSITGKKIADAPAPAPTAIPWLLLGAVSNTGKGVFSKVTYVQRANTVGGKAPAAGCDAATVGSEKRVDYSADYYFFVGAAPQ